MYSSEGRPMNRDQFDKLITELYEQFTQPATNTSTDIDRTVPNRVDHRLLTFKNSEAWLSYNDRFGDPDIYGAMTGHIERMAGHSSEATAGLDRISMIRDAANKVQEMILTEMDFAVPQPGRQSQSDTDSGTEARLLFGRAGAQRRHV
jgi:hypothetical protein